MQTTITSASAAAETASPIPRTRSTCQFSEGVPYSTPGIQVT